MLRAFIRTSMCSLLKDFCLVLDVFALSTKELIAGHADYVEAGIYISYFAGNAAGQVGA